MPFKVYPKLPINFSPKSFITADIFVIAIVSLLAFGLGHFVSLGSSEFVEAAPISTELISLPGYALLSLMRSLIALGISFAFAIIYGTIAARNERNERIMIPFVDVLQS